MKQEKQQKNKQNNIDVEIEEKLKKLNDQSRKDDVITFEEFDDELVTLPIKPLLLITAEFSLTFLDEPLFTVKTLNQFPASLAITIAASEFSL